MPAITSSGPSGTTLKSDNYLIFNGCRIVVFNNCPLFAHIGKREHFLRHLEHLCFSGHWSTI